MQIAVVGAGIIGLEHLEAIASSPEFTLAAICDINEAVGQPLARKYQVPYFGDYHRIPYETEADAVVLNLPHFLHAEAACFFLTQGLHVLVEKPMAMSGSECDRMVEASQAGGKKLAVGHVQRFFAANRKVKEIVDSGELGKLAAITEFRSVDYFAPTRPRWFLDPARSGGGIVMNYGAHALDKLIYITGSPAEVLSSSYGNFPPDQEIEGHAQFQLRFAEGVTASVTFSGYGGFGYEDCYYFEKGALKVINNDTLLMSAGGSWSPVPFLEDGKYMERQLAAFADFLRDRPSEIVTGPQARAIILAIEKIYHR